MVRNGRGLGSVFFPVSFNQSHRRYALQTLHPNYIQTKVSMKLDQKYIASIDSFVLTHFKYDNDEGGWLTNGMEIIGMCY